MNNFHMLRNKKIVKEKLNEWIPFIKQNSRLIQSSNECLNMEPPTTLFEPPMFAW